MTKNQIVRELMVEIIENKKRLELDGDSSKIEERINKIESAIEVIKSLPPRCKRCDDKTFLRNYSGEVISCPECNPYGEVY